MQVNTECQFHDDCAYYAQTELHFRGEVRACCAHDKIARLDGWKLAPKPLELTLINAYGPDHGLEVTLSDRKLHVVQWSQYCEPDEDGLYCPRLEHFTCTLAQAIEGAEKWSARSNSTTSRIIDGALRCMSLVDYDGAFGPHDIDELDEDSEPQDHFRNALPRHKRIS